jgi:hypothetical protein
VEVSLKEVLPKRIATSPPGRGWKPRPEQVVNTEYVRKLLEQHRMTERDEALLRYLDGLPILSSRQIKRLLWFDTSPSNMHRRLRQLYEYYLVDRVRMINKTEGITYTMGRAGRIWLHGEARGTPAPVVNLKTLNHDLAVAEMLVLLTEELREATLKCPLKLRLEWLGEARARIVHKEQVLLEPDGLIRIWGDREYRHYMLEMDMGTERKAAFTAKIKRYQRAYIRTSLKDEYGHTPNVMIVTTTMGRAKHLAQVIAGQHETQRPLNIEWLITTLAEVVEKGIYDGGQWYSVRNDQITGPRILPRVWPES